MSLQLSEISPEEVRHLAAKFENAPLTDVLAWIWKRFGTRAAIGTSFQGAGLVMIDQALRAGFQFPVFTLDTNLLFPETYELKARLEKHWGISIEGVEPELSLEQQAMQQGEELWKRNPNTCCTIRKVMPLEKKLSQLAVWITGVRRQQSDTREKTQILEMYLFDEVEKQYILKANPMANWSREAVWDYIKANGVPYNPLHDRGYRSIGCWPCTRATADGENERAGRWTGFEKMECGIHTFLGVNI
jgi:phosphoadenosine phosphosulfate reductase